MIITLIAAVAAGGVIGRGGTLPWRLPADLRRFRAATMDKDVLLGRRTYEDIARRGLGDAARGPLPGRRCVVLSRTPGFTAPGCAVSPDLDAALARVASTGASEVLVAGGAAIYAAALPRADRLLLTQVEAALAGDTFFPAFTTASGAAGVSGFRLVSDAPYPADADNPHPMRFQEWLRAPG